MHFMKGRHPSRQQLTDFIEKRAGQKTDEQLLEANSILSELESIDSRAAFTQVQNRIQRTGRTRSLGIWFNKVAAVLFMPLFLLSAWLVFRQHQLPISNSVQEITSPPGIRSLVDLPDGSKVWLNAGSTIRFEIPFNQKMRKVDLLGEAFFDVARNPDHPFVVESGKVRVKVLGTHFNCKAFAEDPNVEVILEKGKIQLQTGEADAPNEFIMHPGERAVVNKNNLKATITNEKIFKYIAWHDGKLVFDNTPMQEVSQALARWYGVEVIAKDPEIMKYRFTATFENESLFEVIELLGLSSPIRIRYQPAAFGENKQTMIKSKVLISRK